MEDLGRTGISRGSKGTPTCCQTVEVHEFFWTACGDKKARGHGLRDSLGLLSVVRAKEVAGAGGTALYWSLDRWDTE